MNKELLEIADDLIRINEKFIKLAKSGFEIPMGNMSISIPYFPDNGKIRDELNELISKLETLKNQLT